MDDEGGTWEPRTDFELGVVLAAPAAPAAPVANYVACVRTGELVWLSGHGPVRADGTYWSGKVGEDLTIDEAREAARLTALQLLSSLRLEIGSLDGVRRIVKVFGMVNCAPGFRQTPDVIDGCSDLLVQIFGDDVGRHARSAVGMAELPYNIAMEIEMVCEVGS